MKRILLAWLLLATPAFAHARLVSSNAHIRLQAAIAGSTLEVIPDQRPYTPEEAPRQVADAIARLLSS